MDKREVYGATQAILNALNTFGWKVDSLREVRDFKSQQIATLIQYSIEDFTQRPSTTSAKLFNRTECFIGVRSINEKGEKHDVFIMNVIGYPYERNPSEYWRSLAETNSSSRGWPGSSDRLTLRPNVISVEGMIFDWESQTVKNGRITFNLPDSVGVHRSLLITFGRRD